MRKASHETRYRTSSKEAKDHDTARASVVDKPRGSRTEIPKLIATAKVKHPAISEDKRATAFRRLLETDRA
jgi:hypothetical protein